METGVKVEQLTKLFEGPLKDDIIAVDNLDFEIADGEMLVLVGPSGCGKSTTLRCIAGLEEVTSGKIYIGDKDVTELSAKERDIALVFQNYALYPHMTAEGNMEFGLKMSTDMPKEERKAKVRDVAEMMGIEDHLDKKPGELSGGQQQRVALGRAIVRDPEVFLMDEPLSNLDAKLRTRMRTEILELQREFDTTTIYVTHNQTEAMTMGDQIAVMLDGVLQQIDEPLVCYNKPTNQFVASFIGSPSMNFIDVRYEDTAGEFSNGFFTYSPSSTFIEKFPDDAPTDLQLGIRPEHIEITDDAAHGDLTVETNVIEPHGDSTFIFAKPGEQRITIAADSTAQIAEGQSIHLRFPEELVYLFDAGSGDRLVGTGELGELGDTEPAETAQAD